MVNQFKGKLKEKEDFTNETPFHPIVSLLKINFQYKLTQPTFFLMQGVD